MDDLRSADGASYRRAMRHLPGGVTVATATGPAGPAGVTATAVASVSAIPPVLLVVIDRFNWVRSRAEGDGRLGLSLLAAGQEAVAARFGRGDTATFDGLALVENEEVRPRPSASRPVERGARRTDGGRTGAAPPPLLADAPVALLCRHVDTFEMYDRAVLFVRVDRIRFGPDAPPLVHAAGRYHGLGPLPAG